MSDLSSIEGEMLRVLQAPERYVTTASPSETLIDLYRNALLGSYALARQAWTKARPMAVSYRECYVVAAARLLHATASATELIDVFGYNFKPAPGSTPNIHAEEIILHQAQVLGAITLNLVVVGEPQEENSVTLRDPVLAPCDYRCTPKIIADASVGNFSMTTCVNPLTGATQFIPHQHLADRDWSEIPCIEVNGLNDYDEWLAKASPIIDTLIEQTDLGQLAVFVETKKQEQMQLLLSLFTRSMLDKIEEPHFLASPSSSVLDTQTADFGYTELPRVEPMRLMMPPRAELQELGITDCSF